MKKPALLILIMLVLVTGFSQNRVPINSSLINTTKAISFDISMDEIVDMSVAQNPYIKNTTGDLGERIIGRTYYDLQSNSMLSNRIYAYDDGTVGAVWTMGLDGAPAFDDRGTGYCFFDGSTWDEEPDSRVEDVRTGWPSYAPLGTDGEIIISHDVSNGLIISTRQQKGEGEWNISTLSGPAGNEAIKWPRMITAGEDNNTVHILVNSYNPYKGQERAMLYYRSIDGGNTWDIEAQIIEGTDSSYYSEIDTDSYVWADPVDGTIAFLVSSTWDNDMFMMKSTDNGTTWEKTIIWNHPYPFFDWDSTIADTFYCVDNSASITLDNEGKAHVAFGITRAFHLEIGTWSHYCLYTDGIGYWNEDMPTFSNNLNALCPETDNPESELIENYNLVGWTQDVNGDGEITFLDNLVSYRQLGISTMPSIAVDDNGNIVLAYSSTTETYFNEYFNFKHIWIRNRSSNGIWYDFYDLTSGIVHLFDECIYPVVAQHIGDCGHTYLMYQTDYIPGLALDSDHEYVENRVLVSSWDNCIGVDEYQSNQPIFTVSQNIPNPATTSTSIDIEAEVRGIINLTVSNLLGQVIYHESTEKFSPTYTFVVDVSSFDSGIYFYTIYIENSSVTKKMLIK